MVQRSLYKKANQRVAATRVLEVAGAQAGLPEAIQGLFDAWNSAADAEFEASLATKGRLMRWASSNSVPRSRHYFLLERPDHLMVTFGVTAGRVAERGFNPNDRGWVARVEPAGSSDGGATHIGVALVKWSVDDGGRIWNGDRYVQMLDGLVAGFDGRYVSDPVNEEDLHFVRQT
jgi:hypothetical protein